MNKIKVLMISSSGALGGGPNLMFLLGNKLGDSIDVYYAIPKSKNYEKILNSKNHIDIKERKVSIKDIFIIISFIRRNSINIIHAHGKGAGLIARILKILLKIPIIYTYHGIHLKCHNKLSNFVYVLYENIFSYFDDQKIFVSESEKKYALNSGLKIGQKYSIIHNGVRNRKRKTTNKDFKNSVKKNHLRIISICRFVSQKNIYEILKIAYRLPLHKFIIIGEGPLWENINTEKKRLNLANVQLLGLKKNVFKYLKESDLYLSTSLYEGLPISIIEAMSIGLPILASNVVGNKDTVLHNESGFLYDLGDIQKAQYYINLIGDDLKLRNKIGKASYLRQKQYFNIDKMINDHLHLYQSIL